jgi:hypothetical protein
MNGLLDRILATKSSQSFAALARYCGEVRSFAGIAINKCRTGGARTAACQGEFRSLAIRAIASATG